MTTLITSVKSPSVKTLMGSASKSRIGLTNALSKPSTIATTAEVRNESTFTPGIIVADAKTAKALIRIEIIALMQTVYQILQEATPHIARAKNHPRYCCASTPSCFEYYKLRLTKIYSHSRKIFF